MAVKKTTKATTKTAAKKGEVKKTNKEIEQDSESLQQLKELLTVWEKIPEERRGALLKRAQREAETIKTRAALMRNYLEIITQ